jgi:hypothetical protein
MTRVVARMTPTWSGEMREMIPGYPPDQVGGHPGYTYTC